MVGYVDLDDVETSTVVTSVITCPECGEIYTQLNGSDPQYYLERLKKGKFDGDMKENIDTFEKEYTDKDYVYTCSDCGHLFPAKPDKLWERKEIESLVCPVCDISVPKISSNKTYIGYICSSCGTPLEYIDWPHHGTGEVEVRETTDYFHGVCPNCKDETKNEYSMMVLGDKIWVENSGRVVLSLVCKRCGYRDAVKIKNEERKPMILDGTDV